MQLSRGKLILLAGAAAVYAFFIAWYHAPYAGGSDSSGYLNSAQLLLSGRLDTPLRLPEGMPRELLAKDAFIPLGFRPDLTGTSMVPTYPVGLPLHLVAVGWLTGLSVASTVVAVGAALTFVGLLYLVAREFGVRPAWSAGLAALGAVSPLTLMFALQPMSDLLATVWTLAIILCARRAQRGTGWTIATGAALAMAVLVRPTNLLLLVPALIALPSNPRAWLLFGLGGLPGALFLAWYNHALYGEFFTTGYLGVGSLLGWNYVPGTLTHYAYWVPVVASPLVLAALALPWAKAGGRRMLILATWAGVIFGFYAAYKHTHETWWFLRFVLPALPALGIAAALALQTIPLSQRRQGLVVLALVLASGWMVHWTHKLRVHKIELDDRGYPLTGRWAAQSLPADGVLLAYQVSGSLLHYTNRPFVVPGWLTAQETVRLEEWLAQNRRPLYAALYPHEEAAVWSKLPGRWEQVAQFHQARIWRRIEPAPRPSP